MFLKTRHMTAALALLLATPLAAEDFDRNVNIHNNTGYTIYRFFSTNAGSDKWGGDVMGKTALPNGSSMRLNFDNKYSYCKFDFQIEFEDGTTAEERGVDVCEVGDFTWN